jgi:hypothetical protein
VRTIEAGGLNSRLSSERGHGNYAEPDDAQETTLRALADQVKVSPEALAEVAVSEFLAQPDEGFAQLARTIVEENRNLYERLR